MDQANAERNDAITKAAAVSLIWILAGLDRDGMSEKYSREKGKIHVNLTPLAQS
jgi:hypothetical protein